MSAANEITNTDLITTLTRFPVSSSSVSDFDIYRFKEEVDLVNRDISDFNKFAIEYKDKNFIGKFFTGDVNDKIITATNAIARLGKLTLELQAVTNFIAVEIHSNTNLLNAQQEIINTQQEILTEQGRVVIGLPKQLEGFLTRVTEIRTQYHQKITYLIIAFAILATSQLGVIAYLFLR